jgi:multiple sugar transport system permease protein
MTRNVLDRILLYATVVVTCAFLVFPVYWLFITAVSPLDTLRSFPPKLWPDAPQWQIFADIVRERPIGLWLANSALAAAGAVAISMAVSILAGYGLSRFSVRGGHSLGLFILTAKMLPATLLVIPLFSIFRMLDLIGSLWSIILAHATLIIPFTTWMLKGYFDTIPRDLEEAALMEGASPLVIFRRIVLPLAKPAIAVTALFSFMTGWNEFILAATLMDKENMYTAPVGLRFFVGGFSQQWGYFAAGAIIVSIPIVALFFFLQRYLVSGLTAGSVKG